MIWEPVRAELSSSDSEGPDCSTGSSGGRTESTCESRCDSDHDSDEGEQAPTTSSCSFTDVSCGASDTDCVEVSGTDTSKRSSIFNDEKATIPFKCQGQSAV